MSTRLKGELIHPNKTGILAKVEFSPDGKRILAGDYPGGVIALWDVASGKRLATIEAGYGYHSTANYYAVSPDWQTVFAWREKRKPERVEQNGKQMIRWTFGGEVRTWNLDDGKLLRTYKRQPQSNVRVMRLAPDGKRFYTYDELPGTYERGPKHVVSLWDVKTGTYRTLEGLKSYGEFSPDGKAVTFPIEDGEGYSHGLKLIDVDTGGDKWSQPIAEKYAWLGVSGFTPDGRLMFGTLRVFEARGKHDAERCYLKWWEAATGREVVSFEGDNKDIFSSLCCSPDGQMLAAVNWHWKDLPTLKLFLYSVPEKRLLRTVILGERQEGMRLIASAPTFSPDGKWLAVSTGRYPEKATEQLDPRDLPQPRILLIETATGAIRETMVAPQNGGGAPCFSPDGQTLATGGYGRVLLWDMTKMPQ